MASDSRVCGAIPFVEFIPPSNLLFAGRLDHTYLYAYIKYSYHVRPYQFSCLLTDLPPAQNPKTKY
jgi:hypothetical protein